MHSDFSSSLSPASDSRGNVTALFDRRHITLQDKPQSARALELLWQARLTDFAKAELVLQRAKRLLAMSSAFIVIASLMFSFTLFVTPAMSPWFLLGEVVILGLGLIALPVCVVLTKENRNHRDTLSRKFYQSNHEVVHEDDHLILINRGSYSVVTRVSITEL